MTLQDPLERQIFDAVPLRLEEVVERALKGGELDPRSQLAGRVLHEAARWDRVNLVKRLVEAGVPVDVRGQMDATCLTLAVRYRAHALIRTLIDLGADVNATDRFGSSVLAYAAGAIDGDPGVTVPLLLERGAVVNVRSRLGDTELHAAAVRGGPRAVAALLERDADPTLLNGRREAPVELALAWGKTEAARLLLERCRDLELLELMRDELVASAARGGCLDLVSDLLGPPTRLDRPGADGYLPLHAATVRGDAQTIRGLIRAGADPNARTSHGQTALALASRGRHGDALGALLDGGADPEHVSQPEGTLPIAIAVDEGYPDIAAMLLTRMTLEARALWTHATASARVMQAAARGDAATVREVLSSDAGIPQAELRRVLHVALDRERREVVHALLAGGLDAKGTMADGTPVLVHAARARYVDPSLVHTLLERGADPNGTDGSRRTALHAVAGRGGRTCHEYDRPVTYGPEAQRDLELVAADLLRHRANPDVADSIGETPLMLAAAGGTLAMVRLLIGAGASVHDLDRERHDALVHAARAGADRLEVVRELLRRGADPKRADRGGRTALEHAFGTGGDEVIAALRAAPSAIRA